MRTSSERIVRRTVGEGLLKDFEGRKGEGDGSLVFGAGLLLSTPVESKQLQFGFPGGDVTLVLGTLGGGVGRRSTGECRLMSETNADRLDLPDEIARH